LKNNIEFLVMPQIATSWLRDSFLTHCTATHPSNGWTKNRLARLESGPELRI